MIWFNSISELQFYNPTPDGECYCETLLAASDMQLQGLLFGGAAPYTVTLYLYSADGLTNYATITSSFDIYTAKATNGTDFFNAKLKSFTDDMCFYKCFVINAVVTSGGLTIFDKWTERYCQQDCCETVSGIIYSQDGFVEPEETTEPPRTNQPIVSTCGDPLIRIISRFECIDNFTGEFYGTPVQVFSGAASWQYTKITSIKGRIVPRPRDLRREISYNCRLQRAETEDVYFLEGFEMFPAWKVKEIEGQLLANRLWVDDYISQTEYIFRGGQPFNKVSGAYSCTELFKLETNLFGCIQRQIFGCTELCVGTSTGFIIIPASYNDGGFYDENGLLIATVLDGNSVSPYAAGLIQWLLSQNGITGVTNVNIAGYTCEDYTYAILQIDALPTAYIPTFIYMDSPVNLNRLYTIITNDTDVLCDYIGENPCSTPTNGTVLFELLACATPTNGTVLFELITADELTITNYGSWTAAAAPDTEAFVYGNQVSFSIETTNATIIGAIGEDYSLGGETIASISALGRPSQQVVLNENNSNVPAGVTIMISPSGAIAVTGTFTLTVDDEITLDFDNIVYTLP